MTERELFAGAKLVHDSFDLVLDDRWRLDEGGRMAKPILIDEFHISVRAPAGLRDAAYVAMRRAIDRERVPRRLRRAIRAVFRRTPALAGVIIGVSR